VTTTHRGWWPALEPALLAFAVVVCGGVSLVALSHAFAGDCGEPCAATTRSSVWTAAAVDQDPLDDDDDDDAPDGFVATAIVVTSDHGVGRPLVERAFDAPSVLHVDALVPRGPPEWTRSSSHAALRLPEALLAAGGPDPLRWNASPNDSIDDGDDDGDNDDDDGVDDGADAVAAEATIASHDGFSHPIVHDDFAAVLTLQARNLAPRGPPLDPNPPAVPAHVFARTSQDSSDVDVTDDDDDDDDDDHADEHHRLSAGQSRGTDSILILQNAGGPFSFSALEHSLRAPPQ